MKDSQKTLFLPFFVIQNEYAKYHFFVLDSLSDFYLFCFSILWFIVFDTVLKVVCLSFLKGSTHPTFCLFNTTIYSHSLSLFQILPPLVSVNFPHRN